MAHFNHSGASLASTAVLTQINAHLAAEASCGPIEAGIAATPLLEDLRQSVAQLLNAHCSEVAFTSSAAASWGLAFSALPAFKPGDRILMGRHEWGGNMATMHATARRCGASLEVIPCDPTGAVSTDALRQMLDSRVKLVSLTWCPANGGLVNPAAQIGSICRAAGVPYFVDAGQALGQLCVDVRELQCDVLTGAGRKYLRGPRGTGILYLRREFIPALMPAYLDVRSAPWHEGAFHIREDAQRFEAGEVPIALLLGLKAAVESTLALGVSTIRARIKMLAEELRARLSDLRGVRLLDLGHQHSGLVSFNIDALPADEVRRRLLQQGFNVAANLSGYTPLDMTTRRLASVVRASVHVFNTEDEVDRLVKAIRDIATGVG